MKKEFWKIKNLVITLVFLLVSCFVMLMIIKFRTGLYFSPLMMIKMFLMKAYWIVLLLAGFLELVFVSLGFRNPAHPLSKKVPYAYGIIFVIFCIIAALPIERWI